MLDGAARPIKISSANNLRMFFFLIGYRNLGESVVILFIDMATDKVVYSIVNDCYVNHHENITKQITNLCFTHSLENVHVMRNYLNLETVTPLYGSISDFLRSVNKKYIKLWLKYFEDYSRGKKFSNVKGGMKYGFLEREISKTALINIIMDYIEMYPELKTATKFSKIIKTDKTIHKDIINFSSSLEFLYSTASKLGKIFN